MAGDVIREGVAGEGQRRESVKERKRETNRGGPQVITIASAGAWNEWLFGLL